MSGRRLNGPFAGVVLQRFEISSVEKSSFDAGQATVLDPLREFSGKVLGQRVVRPVPLPPISLPMLAVSSGYNSANEIAIW